MLFFSLFIKLLIGEILRNVFTSGKMDGCKNKTFESEEVIISKLPIDTSFLKEHYYDKVNVKNSTDFHIGPKIEVHINNDRRRRRSKILQDIIPELRRTGNNIKIWPAVAVVAVLILTIVIIITAVFILKESQNRPQNINVIGDSSSSSNSNYDENQSVSYNGWNILKIVRRNEWLAEPAREPLTRIKQPVPQVVITHTASGICLNRSDCIISVRQIQDFHTEGRHWSDIGYNFLVSAPKR